MKAFILYPTYTTTDNKTLVQLFGRLENNQSFITQHSFKPYFFIKTKDLKKLPKLSQKFKTSPTNLTNFQGDKVSKITAPNQTELNKLNKAIHKKVECYEADLKPHQQFLIGKDILTEIEIPDNEHYETSEKIDRIYNNPEIKSSSFLPQLKIISLDIESNKNNNGLICIGLTSNNYKKNFMLTTHNIPNTVPCKSEEELLEKFKQELIKQDPDIITGWNLIDFDLAYLKELFQQHKIQFDLGRTNENARLRIESNFFRSSRADFPGRIVIDALSFIRDPFLKEAPSIKHAEFESYTLENVSQQILNKGKLIKGEGLKRHEEINKLYSQNTKQSHQKIVDYNLMDCQLVQEILEKTKMIDLAIERSQLTSMPIDRITASITAFDSLYIREAHKKSLVSPTTHYKQKTSPITGGYVLLPEPGIYHNVLVLDFKSLYPSVLRTFNIDPASLLTKKQKNCIETPNKTCYLNNDGILPIIIEKLHQAREKAKSENRELASYAIKTIMNSFWGVLASENSRYFNEDMANSITETAQHILKLTAKKIEEKGYKVIYQDTDSCFVATNLDEQKANQLGQQLQQEINDFYNKHIKEKYNRQSFLELEFEKQYLSMLIPQVRGEKAGAKKRYAGLLKKDNKEHIEITGLEAIRGDWTDAAQEFQRQLLNKVFHKQDPKTFIKDYIKQINQGKLDKQLIYRKSIRKNLKEYTKTTPPHVKAARKLKTLSSNIIEYIITTDGPEPIQQIKHKIDYPHYIDKQIKPIANQILTLFDQDFDDLVEGSKQATLF